MTVQGDTERTEPDLFWRLAPDLLERADQATAQMSVSATVDPQVEDAVAFLVKSLGHMRPENLAADPYLVEALLVGTLGCAAALWVGDGEKRRRELRLPLERTRQALRDLLDERHVAQDVPSKEIARWLVDVAEVPQHDIAVLLGVAPRTLQRWISAAEPAKPTGDDETRVRTLARIVDQLRWSMTPTGVIRWLRQPHPALEGRRPCDLLTEPGAYSELARLAAATRAMVAT